jgi:quercetin dioxygenase-like cupin family protein
VGTIKVSSPESTPQTFEGRSRTAVRRYHPGSEDDLQMFEVAIGPDAEIGQHAHHESEIIYVIEGSLILGRQVLEPGASVFIPKETLYSFKAGPDGLKFINFRARQDTGAISKEQFMEMRAGAAAFSFGDD